MKQHHISIEARWRPETLERILRVIRHRGFMVCGINMATGLQTEHIHIHLTVASQRPLELLSAQLTKLLDVYQVDIQPLATQQIRA